MNDLVLESAEISGARKLLLKLEHEYSMSLVPCVLFDYTGQDVTKQGRKECFPIEKKYSKLVGDGMMRWLLESKDNMRKYLYGNPEFTFHYIRDNKGKVKQINITAK